jgi:hypothetical protein
MIDDELEGNRGASEGGAKTDPGIDFAWSVHHALRLWTASADTKASIILAVEVAALGFVTALTADGKTFADLSGAAEWFLRLGFVLLGAAILGATAAVFPQLASRRVGKDWQHRYIYFGHLRHWMAGALAIRLRSASDEELRDVLANELVAMAKIAWRKHLFLQWAIGLGVAAAGAFLLAGVV